MDFWNQDSALVQNLKTPQKESDLFQQTPQKESDLLQQNSKNLNLSLFQDDFIHFEQISILILSKKETNSNSKQDIETENSNVLDTEESCKLPIISSQVHDPTGKEGMRT